ncbi:MAG: 4Fe-4S binding protein [Lachnospiraceae bacterium]|nr:4Fe-4S binding protein [Lachnospiraceae bacterium]
MKKRKYGIAIVCAVSVFLMVSSFFAKDFVLYDFHMDVSDYSYSKMEGEKPQSAETAIWFSFGTNGRELYYGFDAETQDDVLTTYSLTQSGEISVIEGGKNPIGQDSLGHFIASIPAIKQDIDDDGEEETVYDYARADLGLNAFNPAPQRFGETEIPFELVFAERKYIMVYYENEILSNADILVVSHNGEQKNYKTDEHGWIQGLPNRDIREGFTATYSPDGELVYRMYYALEDYPYFSLHFFKAHIPLLVIFALTSVGIVLVHFMRNQRSKRDPAYAIYSRERAGIYPGALQQKTDSKFLLIRWICLFAGMFLWTYAGKLIHQGQTLNEISIPVFSCPFNLDQVVEVPCYYLSHLPALFTRFGTDFPVRNMAYAVTFLITTLFCFVFLGRILCGFLCPAGLLQDLMDKLRQALHIRPIVVTDRMNRFLQPIKWVWIILFLGFAFTGGDFCDICPLKGFTTAQGGYWTNLYLGGFFAVVIMIGSFFIKRFWCIICPMGYLMGIFKKFNLFKLKKDCTSCTECGACYHACPMRIKSIYTERKEENVQTVDCMMCGECIHKCPEDNALSMTFCGKTIYKSSRKTFMSKFSGKDKTGKIGEE